MPKITKRVVDGLHPDPSGRDVFTWDSELKGFGIRMKPTGAASYLIQYRTPQGATRRLAFDKVGVPTPDQARDRARQLLAEVSNGADPSATRHASREALTVAELCDQYLEAARAGLVTTRFNKPKKASTVAIDEGRVSRHIKPLIGKTLVEKLNRAAVQKMADAIAEGKTAGTFKTKARGKAVVEGGTGTAARVVELLGGVWTWAEKRGLASGVNPARGVQKIKGDAKDRVLSADELAALGQAMRDSEARFPAAVAALRLIALTGLRREEACGLRWSEIDKASACLRLTATKTGRSMRPIGEAAFDVLDAIAKGLEDAKKSKGVFVFPNASGEASADLKKAIAAIFDTAGLQDARAHDLRRTFGSIAADEGYGDASIGELLGHAKRGVTERHYIRRADAALIAAADRVSARIAKALDGNTAVVVEFNSAPKNTVSDAAG
ncbi:integrase [Rhodoblastus acidophilus]|uniref:tyrosine-type recombinase/integrase n=1 Tax=Rhodoblastus acidophilus TaxID=1074 RepID=UPI002224B713|nr:site-specific integrase [Rhodoblastus acidophilus]MCW2315101.1 integrase [Rhodoblastus acidophilus]